MRKTPEQVAKEFKSSMQKLSDQYDTTISISMNDGEFHTISEPKNKNIMENEPKKTRQQKEYLKCEFTHDEIHQKGIELARISSERQTIENERKAVAADFKAKIDTKDAEIAILGSHINNGYEYRNVVCTAIFNQPNTGKKTIMRNDTQEVVRIEDMTANEMQAEIEFDQLS